MSNETYLAFQQIMESFKINPFANFTAVFDFESHGADLRRAVDLCLEREMIFKVNGSRLTVYGAA